MQVHHVGYRVRGFYRVADLEHLWEMKNDSKKSHRSDTIELVRDRFRRYVLTVIDPVSASAFAVDARHTARSRGARRRASRTAPSSKAPSIKRSHA